jgi:hypothetical protein
MEDHYIVVHTSFLSVDDEVGSIVSPSGAPLPPLLASVHLMQHSQIPLQHVLPHSWLLHNIFCGPNCPTCKGAVEVEEECMAIIITPCLIFFSAHPFQRAGVTLASSLPFAASSRATAYPLSPSIAIVLRFVKYFVGLKSSGTSWHCILWLGWRPDGWPQDRILWSVHAQ